jgi:hypothetical protein
MVGPSVSEEDRLSFARKVKVGFAVLVGLSMATVAVRFDAGLPAVAGALLLGTAIGGALAWLVIPGGIGTAGTGSRRRR